MSEFFANLIDGNTIRVVVVAVLSAIVACVLLAVLVTRGTRARLLTNEERELARFRQLAEATFSGVFVYRDGVMLDVNAALCSFMGCEPSDLVGHKVLDFVAPHCQARLIQRIKSNILENEEFDVIIKSGEQRTVEVVTRVIEYRGSEARVTALRDISERKRDELLRAEERRILTGIAENRPLTETLVAVCDATEAVLSNALCSILLVSPDGNTLRTAAAPRLPRAYSAAIDGVGVGPLVGSCGTAAYRKELVVAEDIATDPLWVDYKHLALEHGLRACWSVPLIARDGGVLGTFATYHDRPYRPSQHDLNVIDRFAASAAIAIQRAQLDDDLIAARDRAEAANRTKSEFLANMSHELRTPLNAILGFSEMISRQSLGPAAQGRYIEYASDIHESGRHLLSLINDVLDVSRVEAGKVRIEPVRCGVVAVVEEQLRVIRRAYPDSAPIDVRIDPACPDLMVDHRAFGQILINVVGNAVKFTPADRSIVVTADWQVPGLRVRIVDSGPGIPADMVAELCKPFRQVESAYSRRHPGTGLGLYISRSLMRLHGGELEITSELSQGTTVTLVFPEDCVPRDRVEGGAKPNLALVGQ